MKSRARATALRRSPPLPGALVLATGALLLALIGAAHGQSGPTASDAVPPATSPASPAEIQPGHPAPTGNASGPQTAVPTPLPPGAKPDTPGGSARGGVIAPPATTGDPAINKGAPGAAAGGTPVIPPPGSPGGNPSVVPK